MILDADVLIDIDKKRPNALAWINSLNVLPSVSGIAALELKQGCRNSIELRQMERLLRPFDIVWPTEADMNRALVEYAVLRLTYSLGLLDSLIASTAVGLNETVATFNVRHFRAVPGLVTVQPYQR